MLTYLFNGGWIMVPLMGLSILAIAVIIDRMRAFRVAEIDPNMRKDVDAALKADDVEKAILACEKYEGPVAAVILRGLRRYRKMLQKKRSVAEIEMTVKAVMDDYAPKALFGLERRLNLLVMIASVSPLLGMTGTVVGMIKSFDKYAEVAGLDPGAVGGGIAEALITTATGLIVAIPAVVAYNIFTRRIDEQTVAIEESMRDLAEHISDRELDKAA